MLKNHMVGITPAFDGPNYELMRQAGFEWVRQGYSFPLRIGSAVSFPKASSNLTLKSTGI